MASNKNRRTADDWIKGARADEEDDRAMPEPVELQRLTVDIPRPIYLALKSAALERRKLLRDLVAEVLAEHLGIDGAGGDR